MTTSEVATGFIDAMKSQPLSLALVIMNIALLIMFYVVIQASETRQKIVAEQQKHLVELLTRCGTTTLRLDSTVFHLL